MKIKKKRRQKEETTKKSKKAKKSIEVFRMGNYLNQVGSQEEAEEIAKKHGLSFPNFKGMYACVWVEWGPNDNWSFKDLPISVRQKRRENLPFVVFDLLRNNWFVFEKGESLADLVRWEELVYSTAPPLYPKARPIRPETKDKLMNAIKDIFTGKERVYRNRVTVLMGIIENEVRYDGVWKSPTPLYLRRHLIAKLAREPDDEATLT